MMLSFLLGDRVSNVLGSLVGADLPGMGRVESLTKPGVLYELGSQWTPACFYLVWNAERSESYKCTITSKPPLF